MLNVQRTMDAWKGKQHYEKNLTVIIAGIFLGLVMIVATGMGIIICIITAQSHAEGDQAMVQTGVTLAAFFFGVDLLVIIGIWRFFKTNRQFKAKMEELTQNAPKFNEWFTKE